MALRNLWLSFSLPHIVLQDCECTRSTVLARSRCLSKVKCEHTARFSSEGHERWRRSHTGRNRSRPGTLCEAPHQAPRGHCIRSGRREVATFRGDRWIPLPGCTKFTFYKSNGIDCNLPPPSQTRIAVVVRQKSLRPRLEQWNIHVALSQQARDRKASDSPLLSSRTILQRRGVLRESVSKVEHHRNLRRLFVPDQTTL